MRRTASLVGLLVVLALVGCQPASPPPTPASANPPAAKPAEPTRGPAAGEDTKPGSGTPSTWGDTNLPASAAPGMSSDDRAGTRANAQKTKDPNAPHVAPMVTPAPLRAGLSQTTVVEGLQLPVAFELTPDGQQIFVNELYGRVRLVDEGKLQPDPVVTLPTTQGLEQGALGASGLRSPFGLDFQPGTGLPWVTDNGPQGHDEIDRLVKGGNFGWPDAVGKTGGKGRTVDPVWESGIERYGPTGLAFYTSTAVPEWQNDLFFCDWNTGSLRRLHLQPPAYDTMGQMEVIAQPCRLYVRNGPDGALYFSDHHAIYRLGPAR